MNQLSWLIYWADAAPSLASFICVLGFLMFVASSAIVLLGATDFFTDAVNNPGLQPMARRFRSFWWMPVLSFALWGASFLVPSKDTFYLIAASEMGEKAIQTPEFTKLRGVLNKFLDEQLDEKESVKE